MAPAFIGLGANSGSLRENIRKALRLLERSRGIRVTRVSSLRRTKPVGYRDQRDFLNGAARLETSLSPEKLLNRLKEVEYNVGRRPTFSNGPREIDLDLLLYSRLVTKRKGLTIPHPRLHERGFVLEPLAEIAGGAVHPVLKKRISTMWKDFKKKRKMSGNT